MGRKIKKHILTFEFYATSPLYGKYNEICCSNEVSQRCIDHMQWIRGPLPVPQSPLYAADKPPQSHLIYNVHLSFPPLPASASILSSRYILEVLLPFALFFLIYCCLILLSASMYQPPYSCKSICCENEACLMS